jgi:hypothetical protein
MRAAPVVQADLSTGAAERWCVTLIHALAGAVVALWACKQCTLHLTGTAAWTLTTGLVMLCAGWRVGCRWLPDRKGRLSWDGQAWRWIPSLVESALVVPGVTVQVVLDFGNRMLLRMSDGRAVNGWAVVSASSAGNAWHGLRVALQAHGGWQGAQHGPDSNASVGKVPLP